MTRIIGQLEGATGALNGRLYVKAGGAFIGAPDKEMVFKVDNGVVDIDLPAAPLSMPYFVGWKEIGDSTRVGYTERWRVPPKDTVDLEEVRGLTSRARPAAPVSHSKGDLLELAMLKGEADGLNQQVSRLENEKLRLLHRVSDAESNAAAASGKMASMNAEIGRLRRELIQKAAGKTIETERIIERTITPEEWQAELSAERELSESLRLENDKLKEQLEGSLSVTTHFANLHAEIDRLKFENQSLQSQVNDLKQPRRTASALRRAAIANLDQLTS